MFDRQVNEDGSNAGVGVLKSSHLASSMQISELWNFLQTRKWVLRILVPDRCQPTERVC